MRIRRLELLAFGPFHGTTLELEPGDCGLHIVCGPNEAGKSSALRALRQFLFGIPHNSPDTFVHANANLRIGALLEDVQGDVLYGTRRKGRSKTLRDGDDVKVIDPQRLDKMLDGIDEATFCQQFGIDYDELRRGGNAIASGGGDLGKSLFAAGSGIADLGTVQQRLSDEADELFKPRGSVQRIGKALAELKEARQTIKQSQLPSSEWEQHEKAFRQAEARKEEIETELLEKKSERSRLTRIDQALPLIAKRAHLRQELTDVDNAPLLSEDFSEARREAATELKNAEQAEKAANTAIEELDAEIEHLELPEGLLAHRTAITQLHEALGSVRKAAKDRPGLAAQLERAETEARGILNDLGQAGDLDGARDLRLSRMQRKRIQSLAAEYQAVVSAKVAADQNLRKLTAAAEQTEKQLLELPETPNTAELQQAIRNCQKQGDLDERLSTERATLKQWKEEADIALQKLGLWSGPLDDLEKLPVPVTETIERFESEFTDVLATLNGIEAQIERDREKLRQREQQLEAIRLEQDVPTEDDLQQARGLRDRGWQFVKSAWSQTEVSGDAGASNDAGASGDDDVASFIQQFSPGRDLAAAFQAAIEAADAVADRLRREADRVAEKAALTADYQELKQQLAEHTERLREANNRHENLQGDWREQWSATGIVPLTPREMRSWTNRQIDLAETAQAIRRQQNAVAELESLVDLHNAALDQCLGQLGRSHNGDAGDLSARLARCEAVVDEIELATRQREEKRKERERLQGDLLDAQHTVDAAEKKLDQWRQDWAAAVEQLALQDEATPDQANSVLESLDELFSHLKDAEDKRERIRGIDHDAEEFAANVSNLTHQIAGDLTALPADRAAADLYDRLGHALREQTRFEELKKQREREVEKRRTAAKKIRQWQAKIELLCGEAECTSLDQLPEAERRSAQRKDVEQKLGETESRLIELAAGNGLEEFIAEAGDRHADEVQALIEQYSDDIERLESEKSEVTERIGRQRKELELMDGSAVAAEAQERVEHLLAGLQNDAEQFVRLRLAAIVLKRAIERFRDKSQGPVLRRAGELFAKLTLGSFSGLRADYNERDEAVLVGIRPGTQAVVPVSGMSTGTCDQLYLALRLASLELHLSQRGPIPFIVDDILVMFDDDRAVAALKALASLASMTQVIFFTHHQHLVDLAREHLTAGSYQLHEFDHREATTAAKGG